MAAPFYNKTSIFQTVSPLPLIPREGSEWARYHSRDEKGRQLAIELQKRDSPQSKVKVHKILSQPRDIWEIVLCFDVILSFS